MKYSITPPPELVQHWLMSDNTIAEDLIVAAKWGADQELEACCELALTDPVCGTKHQRNVLVDNIRKKRRPKPPSLKDQAFEALVTLQQRTTDPNIIEPLRRALEQLDD